MKYIIRFIAAIPMMVAAIMFFLLLIAAVEYPLLILAAIPQFFVFAVCAENYENTVRHLSVFLKTMANDALNDVYHGTF